MRKILGEFELKKALFIVNPNAGKMIMKEHLLSILNKFNANDYETTVHITQKANDATDYIVKHGAGYDLIVSCGGDGTFNEVIRGIYKSDSSHAPVACIPAGTVNDFAHSLGISSDVLKAADEILNAPVHNYDFGIFNDEIFSYIAAAGAFTEISYSTPQYLKNLFGKYAYYFEGAKKIADIGQTFDLKIQIDDQFIEGNFVFVAVSNTKSIGGILQFDESKDVLTDGLFELLLIRSPQNPKDLQKLMNAFRVRVYDNECIQCLHGKSFKIISQKPLPWTLDGEYAGVFEETTIKLSEKTIQLTYPK